MRFNARLEISASILKKGPSMPIRIKSRQNESVGQMLRRFKKLCEKEGLTKDVKKRQYYEKPSERRRRARRRSATRTVIRSDRTF